MNNFDFCILCRTLSGVNTYSGATTIIAGTLQAGSTTGFSAASAFTVNSTLDLNGFSNTVGSLAGNIQDISGSQEPRAPEMEYRAWYQYYFLAERGRKGLEKNRREFCRLLWRLWSPNWHSTMRPTNARQSHSTILTLLTS